MALRIILMGEIKVAEIDTNYRSRSKINLLCYVRTCFGIFLRSDLYAVEIWYYPDLCNLFFYVKAAQESNWSGMGIWNPQLGVFWSWKDR